MTVEIYKRDYFGLPHFYVIRRGVRQGYSCVWDGWLHCGGRTMPLEYLDIGLDTGELAMQREVKKRVRKIKRLTRSSPLELLIWIGKTPDQVFQYGTI